MPLGASGRLPSSTSTSTSTSPSIHTLTRTCTQTHTRPHPRTHRRIPTIPPSRTACFSLFSCAVSLLAAPIHSSIFPLVSFGGTAEFLQYFLLLPNATMPKSLRLPKAPVKTKASVVVRHDEHMEQPKQPPPPPSIDPTCPICQVDVGIKSPEGVREGYALTPCGHVFGGVCIKKYLALCTADKPLCPVCRTDLFHACAHPVLPAPYDPKKSRLSREDAAAKAFPDEPRNVDCAFCRDSKIKAARRARRRAMLEGIARAGRGDGSGGSSTSSVSADTTVSTSDSEGDMDGVSDSEEDGRESSSRGARALRLALHIVHSAAALGRLTLDATRIRKIKVPEEEPERSEDDDEDGVEEEAEGDIIMPDTPHLTAAHMFPPVPGAYGHWDLANKGPDWKFLSWYDSQEPKTKTTPEHFA